MTRPKKLDNARRGKALAAGVPIRDLCMLERLARQEADRQDVADARAALAEPGDSIPIEALKRELGL